MTLQILKHNKRVQTTTAFENDLNLQSNLQNCIELNQVFTKFPIKEFLQAVNLQEINQVSCFKKSG